LFAPFQRRDKVFSSAELQQNQQANPKQFVWTQRVEEILEKVDHCKASAVT